MMGSTNQVLQITDEMVVTGLWMVHGQSVMVRVVAWRTRVG